jgi:hypothetical protein
MYIYLQKSGELFDIPLSMAVGSLASKKDIVDNGGVLLGTGYSGSGEGRNNPALESKKMKGPIPAGWYSIDNPECIPPEPAGPHGVYVMRLTPDGHRAHGRDGFMIHGDNAHHTASCGCIVLLPNLRHMIGEGKSKTLMVADLS